MVQWLRLWAPNAGGLGLIPDQGSRSYMPQLKIPSAATKTQCSQNKQFFLKKKDFIIVWIMQGLILSGQPIVNLEYLQCVY